MSSSQIIGNNAGTAVPVAVDSSGNVRVAVSGPVSANLYADDGSGTVPVAGEATGELKAQALGTTSGGVLTPLLVDSQGRVVTSGGVTGPTGPAGQSSTFYPYRTNTTPGTGDPGTGLVSWNATNQLAATQIQINHIDQNNVDIDIFLALLSVGDTVTIQDRSNSANYQRWSVSGTPTSQPNYVQVPVTLDAGSWSAPNNHQIIVAFLNAGPVGPTGPVGPAGATGATGATGTATWPGTSANLLAADGSLVTAGSGLTLSSGTLTASGGWTTAYSVNFKSLASDPGPWGTGTRVVDGKTWTIINGGTNLGVSLTNGVGLQFQPGASSGNCYFQINIGSLVSPVTKQLRAIVRMKLASAGDPSGAPSYMHLQFGYNPVGFPNADRITVGYDQSNTGRRASAFLYGSATLVSRTDSVVQPAGTADNMFAIEQNGSAYWQFQGPSGAWNGNPNVDMANTYQFNTGTNAVWGSPAFTNLNQILVGFYVFRAGGSVATTTTVENLIIQTL